MKNKWFKGSKFKKVILIVSVCLSAVLLVGCLGHLCFDVDYGDIFDKDETKGDPTDTNVSDPNDSDEPSSVISFSIDSTLYTAEIGATWGDWCEGRADFVVGSSKITTADGRKHIEKFSGAVVTASDPILSASYKLVTDSTTIIFIIDGTEYTATEGMSWKQWVNSSYNTDGFAVWEGEYITDSVTDEDGNGYLGALCLADDFSENCKSSDTIEKNHEYFIDSMYFEVESEPMPTNTIKFKINTAEYTATEGMTWREWCNSSYNTLGYAVYNNEYYPDHIATSATDEDGNGFLGALVFDVEGADPKLDLANDTIVENGNYRTVKSWINLTPTTPNAITFTVNGKTYTAHENMTWGAWIATEYNTDDFVVWESVVSGEENCIAESATDEDGNGYIGVVWIDDGSGTHCHADDTIVENCEYFIDATMIEVETEEPTPSTITFTINGTSYTAEVDEDGNVMTWQEWVNSPYNTKGFAVWEDDYGNEYITDSATDEDGNGYIGVICLADDYSENCMSSDTIEENHEYFIDSMYFEVESEPTPSTITFYIDDNDAGDESYTATTGMTWAEWMETYKTQGAGAYVPSEYYYTGVDIRLGYVCEDFTGNLICSGEDEDGNAIYVKTSDTIIANYHYTLTSILPPIAANTFTINGIDNIPDKTYRFDEGMTWLEWVNSEYNTDGYVCNSADDLVANPGSYYVRTENGDGDEVLGSNIIDPNENYGLY